MKYPSSHERHVSPEHEEQWGEDVNSSQSEEEEQNKLNVLWKVVHFTQNVKVLYHK